MQQDVRPNLRLFVTPSHIIVSLTQLQAVNTGSASQLLIDCKTRKAQSSRNFNPFDQGIRSSDLRMFEAFAFLGLLDADKQVFAGVVTKAACVCEMGRHRVYRVLKVALVKLGTEGENEAREVLDSITDVRSTQLLESGFFFSYTYDLTQSLQSQHGASAGRSLHSCAHPKFYWNRDMYSDIGNDSEHTKWFLPMMQGFIGYRKLSLGTADVEYYLISRRSCKKAGTRYNARGVDDYGEVANFVESEQILRLGDTWFSLVLVRGTVPVFWQQTGLSARFELTRSPELTSPAFLKSIELLISAYERVLFINLLSSKKPHERVLSDALRRQIRIHQANFEETLAYLEYDYKTETKGHVASAEELVRKASPMLLCFLFFSEKDGEVLSRQKGVARVNCLDCLDRTNVAMCRLAWYMLVWKLRTASTEVALSFDDSADAGLSSFKAIWVENGDVLSRQYTGSGSTASLSQQSGLARLLGLLDHSAKSIERFYSGATSDSKKQAGIEALLGQQAAVMAKSMQTRALHKRLKSRQAEFLDSEDVRVRVVTWNVRGERPPTSEVIMSVVVGGQEEPPDVVAIGLQGLVLANATNVFQTMKNQAVVQVWVQLVQVAFTRYAKRKYLLLKSEVQLGLFSLIFIQSGLAPRLANLSIDKIKFDYSMRGNGAIAVRFNLGCSSLCFVHVHLPHEVASVDTRVQQLDTIETQAFQVERIGKRKGHRISSHDAVFLHGDLNFKIAAGDGEVAEWWKEKQLRSMLDKDELTTILGKQGLGAYREGDITFLPTANRDNGGGPGKELAWTDRILFTGKGVRQVSYEPVDVRLSSHLPVCSTFIVPTLNVNESRRLQVEREEASKPFSLDPTSSGDSTGILLTNESGY